MTDGGRIHALPVAQIAHVTRVGPERQLGPGVVNREVLAPDDLRASSPFILLVEDFISAQDGFHEHPHRGFETVSFVLSGEMEQADHLGHHSVSQPGEVQWMTAGRGIVHGGRPANGTDVHMLQLWLNLPNALRAVAPGTRPQRRERARLEDGDGMTMRIYGEGAPGQWSVYPMTLRDIEAQAGGAIDVVLPAGFTFLYVVAGAADVGGRNVVAGDVLRLARAASDTRLAIHAAGPVRIVAYSGAPIDEPVVVQGPFAAGTEAGIRRAFADLRAGRLLQDEPAPGRDL